jgi:membrane protease YdiL (CAAX protease family)
MRPLRSLFLYLAVVFFGAALLSPWLYWLVEWAGAHSSIAQELSRAPFHRFVNRALLGLALVGLWPFLRSIGARSFGDVGLVKPAGQGWKLAGGLALGLGSLACVAMLAMAAGARSLNVDYTVADLCRRTLSAGLSAVVVAVLEELLFRGALFGALRKAHHWASAWLVSSGVYALVHFFQKPPPPENITWVSGFAMLPRMLHGFAELETLAPGFFALTLTGLILAMGYHRMGNLYFPIGLHAGWVFCLKLYGFLTAAQPGADAGFWGTEKLIDGWLALIVLAPVLIAVSVWPRQKRSAADAK